MELLKFLFLVLISAFISLSSADLSAQQDAQISIGRAHIRYDADSNVLRIGSPTGNIIFAREQNVKFFNFNPAHFNWSTSTGLNLNDVSNHDSVWAYRFTVVKDTGDGEISPYKSRHYTLKKPSWYNGFTNFDLLWYYRSYSSGSLDAYDSCHVINYVSGETASTDIVLGTSWTTIQEISLPVQGSFLIFINFDYLFDLMTVENVQIDDISVRLFEFPNKTLGATTVAYTYLPVVADVTHRGNGSMVIPVNTYGPGETFYLQAKCTSNSGSDKKLSYLLWNYLLVK